jgi:Holliday junction resolvase-like predicted endonuclease
MRGWRVLGQNVRVGSDELDLVLVHPRASIIAIVEVKATRGGRPIADRVDEHKQRRIARAAERLPRHWMYGRAMRFDVATVRVGRWRCRVTHAPSAFADPRR